MNLLQVLLLVGLAAAALDSRTMLMAGRGGMAAILAQRPLPIVVLGALSLLAQAAVLLGGFFAFDWYIWLGATAIALLGLALLVQNSTFVFFYRVSPLLNAVVAGVAVAFWGSYFGFFEI